MSKLLVQLTVDELKEVISSAIRINNSEKPHNPKEKSLTIYRRKDLAKLFGVTVQTINAWVKTGQLPKPTKVGRIPVFSYEQIKHLLKTNE